MINIDDLLNKMNQAEVNVPDDLYEKIYDDIEKLRIKRSNRFILFGFFKPIFKYILTGTILIAGVCLYLSMSRINVSIIEKQGYINIAYQKEAWHRLEKGETIKPGSYIQIGKNSEILIKFGNYFTIDMKDRNIFKIEKMKKAFFQEEYQLYLKDGNHIYTVSDTKVKFSLTTDHAEIRSIGTKFQVMADEKKTYVKMFKGTVAIKRKLQNKDIIENLNYKKEMYKQLLSSMLETEAIISKNEEAVIDKINNNKIEKYIEQLNKTGKWIDHDSLLKLEQYIPVKREKKEIPDTWTYDIGSPIWATPVLYKGNLYFGTEKGEIICLSDKGKINWRMKIGESFFNKGLVYNNLFYIVDSKGMMFAVNIRNSTILWKKKVGEIMYSAPALTYGTLFILTTAGKIMALKPNTGDTIWEMKMDRGIFCEPVIENGKIYFGTEDGIVYCINCFTQKIEWQAKTGARIAVSSPILYGNILYIANNKGLLFALNTANGKELWKINLNKKILSRPCIYKNKIYIAANNGMTYSLNRKGKILWKLHLKENIESSFSISDQKIIIPTKKGKIYIIDPKAGSILKIINLSGNIVSSPVAKNNSMFITTLSDKVYKIGVGP